MVRAIYMRMVERRETSVTKRPGRKLEVVEEPTRTGAGRLVLRDLGGCQRTGRGPAHRSGTAA